jgi:hypothetical protein
MVKRVKVGYIYIYIYIYIIYMRQHNEVQQAWFQKGVEWEYNGGEKFVQSILYACMELSQ